MEFNINISERVKKAISQVQSELPSRAFRASNALRNAELEVMAAGRTESRPAEATPLLRPASRLHGEPARLQEAGDRFRMATTRPLKAAWSMPDTWKTAHPAA